MAAALAIASIVSAWDRRPSSVRPLAAGSAAPVAASSPESGPSPITCTGLEAPVARMAATIVGRSWAPFVRDRDPTNTTGSSGVTSSFIVPPDVPWAIKCSTRTDVRASTSAARKRETQMRALVRRRVQRASGTIGTNRSRPTSEPCIVTTTSRWPATRCASGDRRDRVG